MQQDSESSKQLTAPRSESSSNLSGSTSSTHGNNREIFHQDNWWLNRWTQSLQRETSDIHSDVEVQRCSIHAGSPIHPLIDPVEEKTVEAIRHRAGSPTLLSEEGSRDTCAVDAAHTENANDFSKCDEHVGEMLRRQTEITDLLHSLNTELTALLHEEWTLTGKAPKEFKDISAHPVKDTSFSIPNRLHRNLTVDYQNEKKQSIAPHIQRKDIVSLGGTKEVEKNSSSLTTSDRPINDDANNLPRLVTTGATRAMPGPSNHVGVGGDRVLTATSGTRQCEHNKVGAVDTADIDRTNQEYWPSQGDQSRQSVDASLSSATSECCKGDIAYSKNVRQMEEAGSGTNDKPDEKWLQYNSYELELRRLKVDWDVVNALYAVHKKRAHETKLESFKLAYQSNARKLQDIQAQMTRLQEKMAEVHSFKSEFQQRSSFKLENTVPAKFKSGQKGSFLSKKRHSVKTCPSSHFANDYCFSKGVASGVQTPLNNPYMYPPAGQAHARTSSRGQTLISGTISGKKTRRPSLIPIVNVISTIRIRKKSPTHKSLRPVLPTNTANTEVDQSYVEQYTKPSTIPSGKRTSDCSDWIDVDVKPQSPSTCHRTNCVPGPMCLSRCRSLPSELRMAGCVSSESVATADHQHTSRSHTFPIEREYPDVLVKSDLARQTETHNSVTYGNKANICGHSFASSPLICKDNKGPQVDKKIPSTLLTESATKNALNVSHAGVAGPNIVSQLSATSSYCSTSGCSCLSSPNSPISTSLSLQKPRAGQANQVVPDTAICNGAHLRQSVLQTCRDLRSISYTMPPFHGGDYTGPVSHDVKCMCSCISQTSQKDGDVSSGSSWTSASSSTKSRNLLVCHSAMPCEHSHHATMERVLSTPETVINSRINYPVSSTSNSKTEVYLPTTIGGNMTPSRTPMTKIKLSNPPFILPPLSSVQQSDLRSNCSSLTTDDSTTHHQDQGKSIIKPVPNKTRFLGMRRSISRIIWSAQKVRPSPSESTTRNDAGQRH